MAKKPKQTTPEIDYPPEELFLPAEVDEDEYEDYVHAKTSGAGKFITAYSRTMVAGERQVARYARYEFTGWVATSPQPARIVPEPEAKK